MSQPFPRRVPAYAFVLAALAAGALSACTSAFVPADRSVSADRITRSLNLNPGTVGEDNARDAEGNPIER